MKLSFPLRLHLRLLLPPQTQTRCHNRSEPLLPLPSSSDALESISARGTDFDPDHDELEDVVVGDDEEDFALEPDQDSSIHRFTAARLDPNGSSRSTKIKTEISTVKLEVGTAGVSSILGLVLKDESTKITTDEVQTCGVYTAREEALKREVVALLLSRTVQRKLSDYGTCTPSGDGELSLDGQFETQNGDNPGKESLDSQKDVSDW